MRENESALPDTPFAALQGDRSPRLQRLQNLHTARRNIQANKNLECKQAHEKLDERERERCMRSHVSAVCADELEGEGYVWVGGCGMWHLATTILSLLEKERHCAVHFISDERAHLPSAYVSIRQHTSAGTHEQT